jgi:helix-turn-helix protein
MEGVMLGEHEPFGSMPGDRPRAIGGRDLRTPVESAKYLRRAVQTLAKWRCEGVGPTYYKIGGRVLYLKDDLDSFIAGGRVDHPADAA